MEAEEQRQKQTYVDQLIHNPLINQILFVVLVVLCFIGDILGEFSGHIAVFYWLVMIPVFFLITSIKEQAKELKTGLSIAHFSRFNLIYWISAFIAVLLILLLWHSDAIDAKGSALAIHVVVAQTFFLLGILVGLRFYLLGVFLYLTAGLTIYMEGVLGIALFLALPIVYIGLYFEKRFSAPSIMRQKTNRST